MLSDGGIYLACKAYKLQWIYFFVYTFVFKYYFKDPYSGITYIIYLFVVNYEQLNDLQLRLFFISFT